MRPDESSDHPLAGDGLVTDTPGLILAVQTADCLPVILVDRKRRAVGVFHAGWRGTVKRIVEKGVGEMRRISGAIRETLSPRLARACRRCCYEVGEEVRTKFEAQFAYAGELVSRGERIRPGAGEISTAVFDGSRSGT